MQQVCFGLHCFPRLLRLSQPSLLDSRFTRNRFGFQICCLFISLCRLNSLSSIVLCRSCVLVRGILKLQLKIRVFFGIFFDSIVRFILRAFGFSIVGVDGFSIVGFILSDSALSD